MPTLDFLRDEAAWGDFVTRNVDPRAPNNATTRARRNRAMADRAAYETAQAQQDEADLQGMAMRDRNVNAYLLGQERLGMQRELHGLRKADLEARNAASEFKASMDRQEREDIAGFTQAIMGSGFRRGTPEFANAVAEARMKFPAVPSALFDDTWKMTGINRTPEEVQADIAARRKLSPTATITATEKGTTITDRPVPTTRTTAEMQASIDAAREANPNAIIRATEKGTTITDRPPGTGGRTGASKSPELVAAEKEAQRLQSEYQAGATTWRQIEDETNEKKRNELKARFQPALIELRKQRDAAVAKADALRAGAPAIAERPVSREFVRDANGKLVPK